MRTSSSAAAHLRSGDVGKGREGGFGSEDGTGPGPFGLLCTGGLAFDMMTGGRATAGIVLKQGEGGGKELS